MAPQNPPSVKSAIAQPCLGFRFLGQRRQGGWAPPPPKTLLDQKQEIAQAVLPGLQLDFAQPVGVVDVDFLEADLRVSNRLNLYFFAESHPVTDEIHLQQALPLKNPHSRLGVPYPTQIKQGRGHTKDFVTKPVFERHRA